MDKLKITPHLPTRTQACAFLNVMDGVSMRDLRSLTAAISDKAGSPDAQVDWTEPDLWIDERLDGQNADLAHFIWAKSGRVLNPGHLRGSIMLTTRRALMVPDSTGLLRRTTRGDLFVANDLATNHEVDLSEGVAHVLKILSGHEKGTSADLLEEWMGFLRAHTDIRSSTVARHALWSRLRYLTSRDLAFLDGSYSITTEGKEYLSLLGAKIEGLNGVVPIAGRDNASEVQAARIIRAMQEFDHAKRDTDAWTGWESSGTHRYAIKYENRLYPLDEIVRAVAEGFADPPRTLTTKKYVELHGFEVTELRHILPNLSPDAQEKLDRLLSAFNDYLGDGDRYNRDEREYKVRLFDYLGTAWERLDDNPDACRKVLLSLMTKDGLEAALVSAFDNLVGRFGFADRADYAVYLQNTDSESFRLALQQLFFGAESPIDRISQYRDTVNSVYDRLYEDGKFAPGKKTRPRLMQNFVAILLASSDPDAYVLYRPTEYSKTAEWLGLTVPTQPQQRYALFLEMAAFIRDYAHHKDYPVDDLIDVHNMIYLLWNLPEIRDAVITPPPPPADTVYEYIQRKGFVFPAWLVTDYVLSLAVKPFVILSGVSGTGKTKIAQLVAGYLGGASGGDGRTAFVSVRPDWTDNSSLLGWYNAIAERYEITPVLSLLMRASGQAAVPHFLILDEMNIAKVEHYFSDFLSSMESGELIHLHSQEDARDEESDVPRRIVLPSNLCITGTVNVDESTYMFSPKVLDRASVIEFNDVYLDDGEAAAGGEAGFVLKTDVDIVAMLASHQPATLRDWEIMKTSMPDQARLLLRIHEALRPHHMHFGYRVANEIAAFMAAAREHCVGGADVLSFALDLQIMQKILPKLHGNAAQLAAPLDDLLRVLPESFGKSRGKLERMKQSLVRVGFASFIE